MMRIVMVFVMAIAGLLSACCPATSLNPLSPPEKSQYDATVGGTWVPIEEDDFEKEYLHVGKGKDGMIEILVVTIKENGELEHNDFTVFTTFTSKGRFLNVKAEDVIDALPSEHAGYLFVRYELKGRDDLSIYYMDEDLFSKAIEEGKLKGEVTYKEIYLDNNDEKEKQERKRRDIECVRITDTSENILRFIMENDEKLLFPDGIELRRLGSTKSPVN